jgi:glutamate synthase (NADPH/NADH) large chain
MTGGKVVVLGPVGRNFAAGMSGGIAYLYDPNSLVSSVLSSGDFDIDVLELDDETFLRGLLHRFVSETE